MILTYKLQVLLAPILQVSGTFPWSLGDADAAILEKPFHFFRWKKNHPSTWGVWLNRNLLNQHLHLYPQHYLRIIFQRYGVHQFTLVMAFQLTLGMRQSPASCFLVSWDFRIPGKSTNHYNGMSNGFWTFSTISIGKPTELPVRRDSLQWSEISDDSDGGSSGKGRFCFEFSPRWN